MARFEPNDPGAVYREALRRRLSVLPSRAVAWLVLAPEWPEEVVRLGFPAGGEKWEDLYPDEASEPVEMLRRASVTAEPPPASSKKHRFLNARPIVQVSTALSPWEGDTFRLSPELRSAALEDLLTAQGDESSEFRLNYLRSQLTASAKVMLHSDKLQDYPTLWRWAQLALRAGSDDDLRFFLDEQVKEAINRAESRNEVAVPEVLRWIEAAEFFTEILQGKLELALTLARRRRELFNRRAYDRRKLVNYFRREDQVQAFRELLADPAHWALHYVGSGGLGKTMLLRYLTHQASQPSSESPGMGIVTSRVDFDFLNPDYPYRAPGLLLAALATELRLQAGNDATSIFMSFDASIDRLHDEATRQPGEMRLILPDHPLFDETIRTFASACQILGIDPATGQRRCVVLMLDTCEELSKLRPDGTVPENVRVTFEILKRVKDLADNVRVVFSGRRALAIGGFGWELADAPSGPSLPERDFLRLFVVQGFTEQEASDLLATFTVEEKQVPPDFRNPILDLTRSTSNTEDQRFRLIGSEAVDSSASTQIARHNPYDLDMYADWAVTNPTLTVNQLRDADPHFYVEERIVGRLNKEIRKLLPQLALLGRFDRSLLDAITEHCSNVQELRDEVIAQEWVRGDRTAAVDKWLIEPRLRQRILDYYNDREPAELAGGRRSLADALTAMTLQRPFEELTVQYFSAAFESLKDDPERAAAWWSAVENRLLAESAWPSWGQDLTAYLLAEPAFASGCEVSFRAAVLATEAAAILHVTTGDQGAIWQRAQAALAAYPTSSGRARLEFRVRCGVEVLFRRVPPLAPMEHDEQCRASWLAAVETLTERVEREGTRLDHYPFGTLYLLHSDPDPYIRSFAKTLSARLEMAGARAGAIPLDRPRGSPAEVAGGQFADALTIAEGLPKRQAWLDWRAPDDLVARIELEYLRAFSGVSATRNVFDRARERPYSDPDIDSDRLWSALARELDDAALLFAPTSSLNTIKVTASPICNAHRLFPPLDVTLAERNARKNPVENLRLLRGYSAATKAAGLQDVSLEVDRALTRVILRQRMMSENWLIPPAVSASDDPYDVWLSAVTRCLHMSGTALQTHLTGLAGYKLPALGEGTWRYAETELLRMNIAQLRDDAVMDDLAYETSDAFTEIGDANGAFICYVIEATWRARTGKPLNKIIKTMIDIEIPDCTWADISRAASDDDPTFLDELRPDWRPWIARALAVFVRAGRTNPSDHPDRIVKWLNANHACEIDGQRVLPLEVAFLERPPGIVSRIAEIVGWTIISVFSLALGSLYWWGVWKITSRPSLAWRPGRIGHNLWATTLHVLAALVLTFVAILLIAGITALVQWLARRFTALSWIGSPVAGECRIRVAPEADPNRPLATPSSYEFRTRVYYFPFSAFRSFNIPATTEERYRSLREVVTGGHYASRAPLRILEQLKLRPDFRISVDPASAGGPWEAALAVGATAAETTRFAEVAPRFSRTVPDRAVLAQSDWQSPVNFTTWMYNGLGVNRSSFSWRETIGSKTRRLASEILTHPSDFEQVRHRTGVAYLFGSPIERSSEIFLGAGGVERNEVPYWILPPEIQRRYPNLRLLVVQAPPADTRERTSSDRLVAAQLKRFGARAFECGIPAVLVLPALPLALVDTVASSIFEVVTSNSRNVAHRLIVVTRRLQDLVGAHPHASPTCPTNSRWIYACTSRNGSISAFYRSARPAPTKPRPKFPRSLHDHVRQGSRLVQRKIQARRPAPPRTLPARRHWRAQGE